MVSKSLKYKNGSDISIWTINGVKRCSTSISEKYSFVYYFNCRITSISMTQIKPGLGNNVVIIGAESGSIVLLDQVTLTQINIIEGISNFESHYLVHLEEISSLCIRPDNASFVSADREGVIFSHSVGTYDLL